MPDTLTVPSPLEIRAELEDLILKDLLGPAGGPEEIVAEPYVRDRYVVGLLAPKGYTLDPEEQDDLAVAGEDTEDGVTEAPAPKAATFLPSSIGLTFAVDRQATALKVTVRWGHYDRIKSDALVNSKGELRSVWERTPIEGVLESIPLKAGRIEQRAIDERFPDVTVQGLVRPHEDQWTVTLFLVNGQAEPTRLKDSAWLFQPEVIVESPDGAPIFRKRTYRLDPARAGAEELSLEMLYRRHVEFAVGHGVSVRADLAPGSYDRAMRLSSQFAPAYEVPNVTPPTADEIPELAGLVLDMKALAETPDGAFAQALSPLTEAYAAWIERQADRVSAPTEDLADYSAAAQNALDHCRAALRRIQVGIDLLSANAQASEAFRFMNQAMWQQRVHTLYAERVRRGEHPTLEAIDVPANRSWYPFQLAFILLNLPGITDVHHLERSHSSAAIADLLWFPTGGGKTEAYLGLSAYTMALRRLQGEVAGRSGMAGVAVLMRYTLRLLTLQQFQRAAALICACEIIRRQAITRGDLRWGTEPFRIGLWVGQRTTPNWTDDSAEVVKEHHGEYTPGISFGGHGSPAQLTNCPWCGSPIHSGRDIRVETLQTGRGRTFVYCGDPLGQCPFSQRQSPEEGIPALVVDEEIYRRLPALLIATVDKFAQMPWKGEVQMLFGQINGYCQRHGYRSPEIKDSDSHPKKGTLPPARTVDAIPLRPPDLIILDELHLISGPLGTLVGLYETAVDQLASWEVDGQIVRPKVIASTATIRRAPDQVHALFLRQVSVFPPHGLDIEDSFFALQRPPSTDYPGRLYLGICAPGVRLKTTMIRVYVAALAAAQQLFEKYGEHADPWMTLVGYFNAMRELGGMRRLVEDAVRTRLLRIEERGLTKRYLSDPWGIEELTSRKAATDIPHILDRLEAPFSPTEQSRRKQKIKEGEKTESKRIPIDVLLATNMISVGVDVKRLGLMVVAGQPKMTAEYIQATSRVGRSYPGLVLTVLNWARPRDLSHYERFEHYHATFYQYVEALSVTPFSPRALDRGLTALLVSAIRLAGSEFNDNDGAGRVRRDHAYAEMALKTIRQRAELVSSQVEVGDLVRQELAARLDKWLAQASQRASAGAHLAYQGKKDSVTVGLLKSPGPGRWDDFTCPTSLREVEPDVNLILRDHSMDQEPGSAD